MTINHSIMIYIKICNSMPPQMPVLGFYTILYIRVLEL